jgi:hypothetical protein
MKERKIVNPEKKLTPITVYVLAFVLGIIGYFFGEIALGSNPHPAHWAAGLAGILIGTLLGKLVVRKYGDIFGF